jgi:hypothetical protein
MFALLESVMVVLFRVSPGLENAFWHTRLARLVIDPNSLQGLFGAEPNNVLDPAKAGGVFVNANAAGAYLGIMWATALGLAISSRSRWAYIAAFGLWIGVFFTGSKAATILAIVLGALALLLRYRRTSANALSIWAWALVPLTASLGWIGVVLIPQIASFSAHTASTVDIRTIIWNYGPISLVWTGVRWLAIAIPYICKAAWHRHYVPPAQHSNVLVVPGWATSGDIWFCLHRSRAGYG